ncbi:MAG: SDR family oxidoreductase [Bacteroidetes bacterium]|nr:SDR family oxidoreductase [Bacteroidota bacterium]MDA1120335.1 SDR family oxidoreductase [Bacteroidota bacterium]
MKSTFDLFYGKSKLIYALPFFGMSIFFMIGATTHQKQSQSIAEPTSKQVPSNTAQQAASTVLITGANRGLGLEMARQFSADGYYVIGTARSPLEAIELKSFGVQVEQLDVTDIESVAALAKRLKGKQIDILINNAGYFGPIPLDQKQQKIDELNLEGVERCFEVNTLGPMRVTQALLPNLYAGKERKIINISTRAGILANSYHGGKGGAQGYGYKQSKAALNMFTRILAGDLKPDNFIVVSLAPGWVKTDMGTQLAEMTPEESILDVKKVIETLTPDHSGGFWFHDGSSLAW